jgi:hypothetical protein
MLPEGLKSVRPDNYFKPTVQGEIWIECDSVVEGEFQGTYVSRILEMEKGLDSRDGVVLLCQYHRSEDKELDRDCRELLPGVFAMRLCGKSNEACPVNSNGLEMMHQLRVRRIKIVKKGAPKVFITNKGAKPGRHDESAERSALGPAGGALVSRPRGSKASEMARPVAEDAARVRDQLRAGHEGRDRPRGGREEERRRRSVVLDRRGVGDDDREAQEGRQVLGRLREEEA